MKEQIEIWVKHREFIPEDLNIIIDTWSKAENNIRALVFKEKHRRQELYVVNREVKKHITNPNTKILLAVDAKDPRFVLAYIVYDNTSDPKALIIHYVYTKWKSRLAGLARDLYKAINPNNLEVFTTVPHTAIRQLTIAHTVLPHKLH